MESSSKFFEDMQLSGDGNINGTSRLNKLLPVIYLTVAALMAIRFCISVMRLIALRISAKKVAIKGIIALKHPSIDHPFSFFKWLFIPGKNFSADADLDLIVAHENYHWRLRHTVDRLFAEIVLIIFWFNPFFYYLKKELELVHEFQVDENVLANQNNESYTNLLLTQGFGLNISSITHSFFKSPIKLRIMMFKNRFRKKSWTRQLFFAPLLFGCVYVCCVSFKPRNGETIKNKPLKVLVDAGHGGSDAGVIGFGSEEKTLALDFALALQAASKNTSIEVLLTRDGDELPVPGNKNESLRKRVSLLEERDADILLSLHINGSQDPADKGIMAFVSNKQFRDNDKAFTHKNQASQLLASILLRELSASPFNVSKTIQQRREEGIYVLDAHNKPAVLLELGCLTNEADATLLKNANIKKSIAQELIKGLESFATESGK